MKHLDNFPFKLKPWNRLGATHLAVVVPVSYINFMFNVLIEPDKHKVRRIVLVGQPGENYIFKYSLGDFGI